MMGRDAEQARCYSEISDDLSKIAAYESNAELRTQLFNMSSDYKSLAHYFWTVDERAGLRRAGIEVADTEEQLQATRDVRATLVRLQAQWRLLAQKLDGERAPQPSRPAGD